MGIGFIFFIFGLAVSAKEENLQGFRSLPTESATLITTVPSEEQNSSGDNGGKVSTESPARLTVAIIGSPGTDLFHTPHERQHSSTVNATTTTDKDAITSNGPSFVLAYGTGSHSTGEDGKGTKPIQSDGDLSLISNDEKRLHPSAEAEFKSMMNDTMTPASHLSRGREKISAFFHASLESKNQRVSETVAPSPANGIPMVSASDPAVIDNLGESNKSVERWDENKTENWTPESSGTDDPLIRAEEVSLNKSYSTIMHFTVLQQGAGLLTTELGQNPRNGSEHEPKEQKNLLSPSSLILGTPLQVKSTSQVIVNKMAESSKNPSTNGPKPFLVSLKHPDWKFLFSASKLTPTKNPDATTLNYFSNMVTAAGKMHVTKQFVASRLISDSVHRIVSARDGLESKSIFHSKSSKERQIKPALQTSPTSFLHRQNKSDLSLAAQNFSSLLKTSNPCTKGARTSNISVMEKRNRMDHFPVWLSELMAFSSASLTNAEEAATASDKPMFMKQTQSSLAAARTLSRQEAASKQLDQFDELSTVAPLPPLTKLKNVFHVFKVNDHQPRQPLNNFPSERLKPFVSVQGPQSIPPSFTYATVKRFANMEDFTKLDSMNQNQKAPSDISERQNMISDRLTRHEIVNTTPINKNFLPHFSVPPTNQTPNSNISTRKAFITSTMFLKPQESFANISLFSQAVPQKKSFLLPTVFAKSQNTVITDSRVLSISKKHNSEYAFLNHSTTAGNVGLPLDDKQHLKNPRGTVMLFFSSYTVSSIPSVQQLVEAHPGEKFLTETPQSQSGLQIESYLKKRDGMVKPTTLKDHDQSSHSVADMNQTSSISHRIVSNPIHTTVSPVASSNAVFKQHLTFSPFPSVSIEETMVQINGLDNHKDSLHVFVNLSDVKKHSQNISSSPISGISRHTTAAAQPEGALNTSALKSFTRTTSPTFPLNLINMQNMLHKELVTLAENQTEFFSTVNEHSQTTQSNFPSDEKSSSGATEDVQKHLGRASLSAVTGEKFSPIVHTDLSFSSTETQSLPKGSLQSREGSEDISHGTTPFAESDSGVSAEFMSDLPVINRKRRIISPDSLSGLAQISDDICGTGNYTAEMSLNLERDIMPGDLIPALGNLRVVISLKTNNSQVNLEIKSCCLSPTIRLDEFNTTCCIFSRLPIDPHGIRLLPSVLSKRASFTISLFQMINYSTAYLHCDLSVCLRNHSECERQCVQSGNAHLGEEAGAFFSTGNRISFGPVLKEADNSSFSETADDTEAVAVIISSVAGCLLACLALFLVWMANRRCLQRSAYCWSRALCEC